MLVLQFFILSVGIETFEYFKYLVQYCLKKRQKKEEKLFKLINQDTCISTLDEYGLRFIPPMYVQRYMAVQEILEHSFWQNSIKKVIDFGCSEMGMFKHLKSIVGLEHIILVDIDDFTLEINQNKVIPTNYDYFCMNEKKNPLTVDIYHGSISDLDDRLLGADAVICIELIEHLYAEILEAVPFTVFEFIKPKLAIFTTPNVEYNILFPNSTSQFRHYDHKFEWNRKQFSDWIQNIVSRYPEYTFQIDGIGPPPLNSKNFGHCSQMVTFYRKNMQDINILQTGSTPYKLLRRVNYPFNNKNDNNRYQQIIFEELRKCIGNATLNKEFLVNGNLELPLNNVMPFVSTYCSTVEDLQIIISKYYEIKKNDFNEWILVKPISNTYSDYNSTEVDDDISQNSLDYYPTDNDINSKDEYCEEEEEWNSSNSINFGNPDLCFSTPMIKHLSSNNCIKSNQNHYDDKFSNSSIYEIANKEKNDELDMELSTSCNNSFLIDVCPLYQNVENNKSIENEDTLIIEDNKKVVQEIDPSFNKIISVDDYTIYHDFTVENLMSNNTEDIKFYSTYENDNRDMELSSSCNNSIILDDVSINNPIIFSQQDTLEENETLKYSEDNMCDSNSNNDVIYDTVIENK
ncbi:small RNA 2'-O-methyltransferase [Daktulosphaira vitifoliae]|uniref:small RNA 2'-O-methyltransferase n=1 Tax=Daktulosphaira vitifoliae TaxID=58002 RepID=UPI0021A9970D|nr:small RNA 2'-O-methyltransferase [Daktulosphaira vitifoliae]